MKQEGADRARDCPDRKLQGGKRIALRLEHALDQEDGGDREEDVLSEEESDVVGRRGHCAHLLTLREGKRPMGALGGGLGHGGYERAHRLRVPTDVLHAQRCGDLAKAEVEDEQASHRRSAHLPDERTRPLLKPVAFEEPDHGKDDPGDGDIAVIVEGLAQGLEHGDEFQPAK